MPNFSGPRNLVIMIFRRKLIGLARRTPIKMIEAFFAISLLFTIRSKR